MVLAAIPSNSPVFDPIAGRGPIRSRLLLALRASRSVQLNGRSTWDQSHNKFWNSTNHRTRESMNDACHAYTRI